MSIEMKQDHLPPYTPSYGLPTINTIYVRPRAISEQPMHSFKENIQHVRRMSADPCHVNQDTHAYIQPLYPAIEEIEEEVRFLSLHNTNNNPIIASNVNEKVHIKEIWEAGLGIHTGFLKSLKKKKDTGGETVWKSAEIQIVHGEVKVMIVETHQTYSYSLKYASIGLDKISDRKNGLYIQLVNGKTIKISFMDVISLKNGFERIQREIHSSLN